MIKFLKQLIEKAKQEILNSDTNSGWNTTTATDNSNVGNNISKVTNSNAQHELISEVRKITQELTEFQNVLIALSKLENETNNENETKDGDETNIKK